MKLRVRLGRRTVVCSLDESHGEPTVVSAKEEVRNLFELANVPFSLRLNGNELPDINDNTTLIDLGVVSGDLVFVVVAGGAQLPGNSGHNDNRPRLLNSSSATETLSNTDSSAIVQNPSTQQRIDIPPPSGSSPELPLPPNQGLLISATDNPNELRVQDNEAIHDAESSRCLNEPMFVRDSTIVAVPQTLRAIVESGVIENSHDALCCVLHLLMLEAGFRSLPSAGSDERLSTTMPLQWRFPGTYRFGYDHPACEGTTFELLCVPLGSAITIHGTVKSSSDAEAQAQMQDMSLNVNEFVQENHTVATQMYRNLPKLSRLFKDGLVNWLLQMGQPDGDPFLIPCLQGLPMELKLMVMKNLDARSLVHLSAVCKEFLTCGRERILWRRLYLTYFGRRTDNDLAQDWSQLYKDKVVERRAIREMYRQQTLIFTSGPFPDRHPPLNPYLPRYDPFGAFHPGPPMPGFIGGEYDLRPNFPGPFRGRLPRPRFDPFAPFPNPRFRPGRGGGLFEGMGGFGPPFP